MSTYIVVGTIVGLRVSITSESALGVSFHLVAYLHRLATAAQQNVWPVQGQNIADSAYMT